jgi:hypothetical protein
VRGSRLRETRQLKAIILCALAAGMALQAKAEPEQIVEIETRPGIRVRALLSTPHPALGSVILLAGGDGHLRLGPLGEIGWGSRNQLVRSRALYAAAGYAALVPDVALDLVESKTFEEYRSSEAHIEDIGGFVAYMRRIAPPVFLIGTSRAAVSVVNAAIRLGSHSNISPDGLVITSGMLIDPDRSLVPLGQKPDALATIWQPTFLLVHENDECPYTSASATVKFRSFLLGAEQVLVLKLGGGNPGAGDPKRTLITDFWARTSKLYR